MSPPDGGSPPEKDPAAFRTIREVSELLGVPQHVLRFWETRFPELKPLQRGGNRRYYRPADVAFASALHKLLHKDGYTVKGVRKLIGDFGAGNLVAIANGQPVQPRGRGAPKPPPPPVLVAAATDAPTADMAAGEPAPPVPEAPPASSLGVLVVLRERLAAALASAA